MRYLVKTKRLVVTQSDSTWRRPYPRARYKTRVGHLWGTRLIRGEWVDVFGCSYTGLPTIEIDYSLGPVIAKLAELGCVTSYCCSGLALDHEPLLKESGYIAFLRIKPIVKKSLPKDMYYEKCNHPCIRTKKGLSERGIGAAWFEFYTNLSK